MCGFVGFLSNQSLCAEVAEEQLIKMSNAIAYRGPDDTGFWVDDQNGIGLGHRRLSVLDLSAAGHQPMISCNGRYTIVFNGEIYNHARLRLDMGLKGFNSWRGHSDTETLLAGFEIWGIRNTLERAVGMFAFAVWDAQEKIVILGRDRVGEKPLYYGWQGKGSTAIFLFGSELKALRAHPAFNSNIDRNSLALYMRHNNVPAPHTIFQNIYKLMPGTLLRLSIKNPQPSFDVYWSASEVAANGVAYPFQGSAEGAVDALESLLKNSISQQMIADVPLGAFLSGGVDSSLVTALMQAQSSKPIKTFTIGFNESSYDEAVYSREVAKHLGTHHTELYVSPRDAMSVIPQLPTIYDEPFSDSSQIPTFLVSQLARRDVTVSLSGDAGDELFCGYNRYRVTAGAWGSLSRLPTSIRSVLAASILKLSPQTWSNLIDKTPLGKNWVDIGYKLHKGAMVLDARSVSDLYIGLVSQWSDPASFVLNSHEPLTLLTEDKFSSSEIGDVEQMMLLDLLSYLPDDILTKVDRAAMASSLETRIPFLDHHIIEFAWSLPLKYKLRKVKNDYVTKWVLREVLYRYVPKEFIERPKMGFGIPLDQWLRGPLRDWAENLLSEDRLRREGFLNPGPIRKRWEEHLSGAHNWQHSLWSVLMFQAWLADQDVQIQ